MILVSGGDLHVRNYKLTGIHRMDTQLIGRTGCKTAPQFLGQRQLPCQSLFVLIVAKVCTQYIIFQLKGEMQFLAAQAGSLIEEMLRCGVCHHIFAIGLIGGVCPVLLLLASQTLLINAEPLGLTVGVLDTEGEEQALAGSSLGNSTGELPILGAIGGG